MKDTIYMAMNVDLAQFIRPFEYKTIGQFSDTKLKFFTPETLIEIHKSNTFLNSDSRKDKENKFNLFYKSLNLVDIKENQDIKKIEIKIKVPSTIVIAEDEDINFMLLNVMLSKSNLTILRASNGQEAVDICKAKQQIDLVLMDIRMPIMNGYEATKQIKALRPKLPIIVQTAYSSEADKAEAFASGCSDFINKPINRDLLIYKINTLLNV